MKGLIITGAIGILAIFAMFSLSINQGQIPVFHVVSIKGEPYYDTTLLTGLDINEGLADDIPALTGRDLYSLGEQIISTKEDTTRYFQILRFASSAVPSFSGGRIQYTRDELGEVSDFLTFMSDEPMFEYEMVFSPGLKSRIEGNELIDFEGEYINILGGDFSIFEGELRGSSQNIVELTFIGDNYIEFKDDYTDNIFSDGVEINGRNIDADVKIRGVKAGNKFIVHNIVYRFEPNAKLGSDLFIPAKHGTKKFLREPEGMLTRNFEIVYGGLRQARTVRRAPTPTVRRGPGFDVTAAGDDAYDLQFTNNRGQRYKIPFIETTNGGLLYGEAKNPLKYVEGSFVINEGDYFIVTSREKTSGITNILEYDRIRFDDRKILIRDLAGGNKEFPFDENGEGTLSFGGSNYQFDVSSTSPHPISVDMNNNGNPTSGEAKIIIAGGPKLDIGSSNTIGGSSRSISLTIPSKLFKGGSKSDEVTSFTIVNDNGGVDILLKDQATLDVISQAGVRSGMTNFGALWVLEDRREPAELTVLFPGSQAVASVATVGGGQAQGFVIVTLQLDELLALARR